jgi:hypothetical protein
MKVIPPKDAVSHPGYVRACEEVLDRPIRELVDAAISAGWDPQTVGAALSNLATAQILAYNSDPDPADDPT